MVFMEDSMNTHMEAGDEAEQQDTLDMQMDVEVVVPQRVRCLELATDILRSGTGENAKPDEIIDAAKKFWAWCVLEP